MNIYISTSNDYLHVLKPFSYLFNKFWSDEQKVFILGYEYPTFDLPNNFEFISMNSDSSSKLKFLVSFILYCLYVFNPE